MEELRPLVAVLPDLTDLEEIKLENVGLNNEGAELIGIGLYHVNKLRGLNIAYNCLGADIKLVLNYLMNLRELDISGNELMSDGPKILITN